MLNHFNFKKQGERILVTNDLGMYAFLSQSEFQKLLSGNLTDSDSCYSELNEKFFISDIPKEAFIAKAVSYLRSQKSYTFTGTALHIFAVTNSCNMNCVYCQAQAINSKTDGFMSIETGIRAVELAMQSSAKHLTFEFQGGEPLLNFDVVKAMVAHSKKINSDKEILYTIVTNLVSLDDAILDYLLNENISICTSVDGCADVHNYNRRLKNGFGSYDAVRNGIERIRATGRNIGAIQTTTRYSLDYPTELVSTYVNLDVNGIFIRPLTPLGIARTYWDKIGYTTEEYLNFYRAALEYIIEINIAGKYFPEQHATYFLKKILGGYSDNYMELRSPCGASIGQLSYYHDGSVYTCDEGRMLSEMGDNSFLLGSVYTSNYDDLMNCSICKATCAASIVETIPHCCDCAYHPYCGVCPVVAYAELNDIFPKSPRDYRCRIYQGILDILFEKIAQNDDSIMRIFRRWIEVCDD